jgi:TRAP-type C4-dicarboxylate transport system permease small subunit
MNRGNSFLKLGKWTLDIVEIYIPVVTFVILFLMFVIQIFFRYCLNNPLTWTEEITLSTYIWTVMFAAAYARRTGEHVAFTMFYDNVSPVKQAIFRIVGNVIVMSGFIIALYPSYDFVMFQKIKVSTVFRIPFHIVYFPFLVFIVLTIGHSIYDIVADIRFLTRKEKIG